MYFGRFAVLLRREISLFTVMRVIAKSTLIDYYTRHPQAKNALCDWYEKTAEAEWHSFSDMRQTFATVSQVGRQHYVFNIKGNDYRLVVVVQFTPQAVYIRFIGTHAEYDRIRNIDQI